MKTKRLIFCTVLFAILLGWHSQVLGAERTATNSVELRTALSIATSGDVIKLLGGVTYNPDGAATNKASVFEVNTNVTISGGWNPGFATRDPSNPSILSGDYGTAAVYNYTSTPISMSGSSDNAYQVLVWNDLTASQGELNGVVIIGGGVLSNPESAGLTLKSGKLKIVNSTFKLNHRALYAGAGTTLTVDSCTFTQNYSGTYGTAVTLNGNIAFITNSIFENNGAAYSPVYLNNGTQLTVSHSTFNHNLVTMQGAAVIGVNGGTSLAKIIFSTFANNSRTGAGNARDLSVVLAYGGKAETYHCTFTGNSTQGEVLHARGSGARITYGGNIFLGNTTNDTGINAFVNVSEGGSHTNLGHNVLNTSGGGFTGIGNGDVINIPSTNIGNYLAGTGYSSGSLYIPTLTKPSTSYSKVVMPDGVNGTTLIVVPVEKTEEWLFDVWGSSIGRLTDQCNVLLQPIAGKIYAGSVHARAGVSLDLTIFLQGVLQSDGTMTNYIQEPDGMIISLFEEPKLPVTDPYDLGATCNDINDVDVVGKVVDWIKVEIWKDLDANAGTKKVLESQALLLLADGSIVDVNGNTPTFGSQTGSVHLVVMHRNHLAVISNEIADFSGGLVEYDFSEADAAFKLYAEETPMMLRYGHWCMWAGDFLEEGSVSDADYQLLLTMLISGEYGDYYYEDVNMNGYADDEDISLILSNFGNNIYSTVIYFPVTE